MIQGGTLAEYESQHRAGRGWLRGDQEIQHYRSSEEPRRKYAPRGGKSRASSQGTVGPAWHWEAWEKRTQAELWAD